MKSMTALFEFHEYVIHNNKLKYVVYFFANGINVYKHLIPKISNTTKFLDVIGY